jgi:hypothetical protein
MSNNTFFKKMLELNQLFEASINKLEILKERNREEYQKYSLSITNIVKSKSIIESIYKKSESFVFSNENKYLTENEMIDNELPQLKIAMRFILAGKEKAKAKFEKTTDEYFNVDKERNAINDVLLSLEYLEDLYDGSESRNQKIIEYITKDIESLMEDQNVLLDAQSIKLTFSCDVLELFINLEQTTEKAIEDFSNEILIETIDL